MICNPNNPTGALMKKEDVLAEHSRLKKLGAELVVDEAFIDTIGRYVSEAKAVADASGLDPEDVFSDLGNRTALLGERMDDLVALVTAARGLSDAADELLKASRGLSSSTEDALSVGEQILEDGEDLLPDAEKDAKDVSKAVKKEATAIASGLDNLNDALSAAEAGLEDFNEFVEEDLDDQMALVSDMAASASDFADRLSKLGLSGLAARFERLADRLNDIYKELDELEQIDEADWEKTQEAISRIQSDIKAAADAASSISEDAGSEMDDQITQAIADTRKAIEDLQKTLDESYGNLESLDSALRKSEKALNSLDGGLNISIGSLLDLKSDFTALSGLFDSLADSDDLKNINYLLSDGTEIIAEKLASPIVMETETIYPVKNFGSMMAPFYTILSLWVGALFSVVMISTRVRRRDGDNPEGELRLHEQFFGRYRLFLVIGIAQALIVSLGDLLYVGIQCHHPILFVLAACIIGMVFMMINYALVFVFGKIGLALSVIIVVLQVAGSGGTFPPEVLPGIFRSLYPFMPFHYALNAMRECVAGTYGHTYLISILILLQFGIVAAALGLLLARPGAKLTDFVDRSIEDNDLIES